MAVGLIAVVSGERYVRYAEEMFASAREHVTLPLKTYMLEGREGWPDATLYRYHAICEREWADDWLFLVDADMLFEAKVGTEILGELVGTQHPGYVGKTDLPFETRACSQACVPRGDTYYCGGFVGGRTDTFLLMAERICSQVDHDAVHGVTAVWHDESHLNRVFSLVRPSVMLSPSYCYPDDASGYPWLAGMERKLVAVDKPAEVRAGR